MNRLRFAILVTLSSLAGPVVCRCQDITTGLIAYYPFNGNADDATGNGNNGSLVNGPTLTTDKMGNPNSAYYFDGVDDYIKIPGGAGT
ncbi:MAG TPA: hypothetical protein VGM31_02740, partial [Puia sp.]